MQLSIALVAGVLTGPALASLYNETSLNHSCVLRLPPSQRKLEYPNLIFIVLRAAGAVLLRSSKPVVRSPSWLLLSFDSPNIPSSSVDSCCTETYGGLLLSTQYWDTYTGLEDKGQLIPPETWTLHGTKFPTLLILHTKWPQDYGRTFAMGHLPNTVTFLGSTILRRPQRPP